MNADGPVVHDLLAPVATPRDGIVSRTIHDDAACRVVLFSFAEGQELSDHTAAMPVTLQVVAGDAVIGVAGRTADAPAGSWLHLEARTPHSVLARSPLTLLLTMIKPGA